MKPVVRHLVSGLEVDGELRSRAFLTNLGESCPGLTLGGYFTAVEKFLFRHEDSLAAAVEKRLNSPTGPGDIGAISISLEKHGAFYHPACLEVDTAAGQVKFVLNTAVSRRGREWMRHEFAVLGMLNKKYSYGYLPQVYFMDGMEYAPGKKDGSMLMFLGDWFEDYHEWHLTEQGGGCGIVIWDAQNGHRSASEDESREIYEQSARILTLYYDTQNYSQIYPWHHAAGDFIVRTRGDKVDARLTTAREYAPFMPPGRKGNAGPYIALTYFFLNLTVKMRLDKLDGTGQAVFAGHKCLPFVVGGFFSALLDKEIRGDYHPGKTRDLFSLFQSFSRDELGKLLNSLSVLYQPGDPGDYRIIRENLDSHADRLYAVLQDYQL